MIAMSDWLMTIIQFAGPVYGGIAPVVMRWQLKKGVCWRRAAMLALLWPWPVVQEMIGKH